MTIYDLHCHSTASDGVLSPAEVVSRAHEKGVHVLALTDHDTIAGLTEARLQADVLGLRLINGVEISTDWEGKNIHIVGLNFDQTHPKLTALLCFLFPLNRCRWFSTYVVHHAGNAVYFIDDSVGDFAE